MSRNRHHHNVNVVNIIMVILYARDLFDLHIAHNFLFTVNVGEETLTEKRNFGASR